MRLALGVVALLGVLAGVAGAATVAPYDSMRRYATEAEFLRSIQPYQVELAANPRNADAAYWLGYAYWEASIFYRNGWIPYGADYLDKSIAALERAVSIDDRYLAAWLVLISAYHTRARGATLTSLGIDDDKSQAAAIKAVALGLDFGADNRATPQRRGRGAMSPQYVPLPDRAVKFNPANYFAVGDRDTKLVYRWPCASLPPIQHGMFFLTKWEAFERGYTPAKVCPP